MSKYKIYLTSDLDNLRIWQVISEFNGHKILLGEFYEHSDALLFKKARIENDEELSK